MYQPAFVQQGNDIIINVHEEAGLAPQPISYRSLKGQIIDASNADMVFKITGTNFIKPLGSNPSDPRGRTLSLSLAEMALIADGARWVIIDRSGAVPVDLSKGAIRRYR